MENIKTLEQLASYKHPYYCSDESYFRLGFETTSETWDEFYAEMGEMDNDYNLVFRWDVRKRDEGEYNPKEESLYYMEIFIVHQRKGRFVPLAINNIYEKDLPQILEYLKDKHEHLKKLWQPFE